MSITAAPVIATRENMEDWHARVDGQLVAVSLHTEEKFSAAGGDYFWLDYGDPLVDAPDEPMVLAVVVPESVQLLSA